MPSLACRLLLLLSRILASVLGLARRWLPAAAATPRRTTPGLARTRQRHLHSARPVTHRPSRRAPNVSGGDVRLSRSQAPKCTPPRLKSFLEKTLTAHARPQSTHPQRLHSQPKQHLMQTPARPVEGLAT